MHLFPRPLLAAALAVTITLAPAAQADEATDASMVLATVNGTAITLGHVIAVRAGLPAQYDQFPAALLLDGIVDQLVQQTLLMQSLDGELSRQGEILLENERRAIIAGEVIAGVTEAGIDEATLLAAYDAQYPDDTDQLEYRGSHILVGSKQEAEALIAELQGGADFAALARANSTGPSASVGGDLGWFGEGDMVSEFFDAVAALEPAEVSPPVQTDFGWHVITLVETRNKARPDFETVRAELASQLREAALSAHVKMLEEKARVERADTSGLDPETINDLSLLEN